MEEEREKSPKTAEFRITRRRLKEAAGGEERFAAGEADDRVACERAVNIEVNGRSAAVIMASPGEEEELAAGFVWGEGLIGEKKDLLLLRACDPEEPAEKKREAGSWPVLVKVVVPAERIGERPWPAMVRYACGAVGEGRARPRRAREAPQVRIEAGKLREMLGQFGEAQAVFRETGGTHAAGLFGVDGQMAVLREDIGRHNAVDRVLGHALLHDIEVADKVLVVSGRASADLVYKALAAGVAALASLSAPTALAVDWAREGGLVLVGFLRPRRFNIYAGHERID